MYCTKKSRNRAEGEDKGEKIKINFARILYVGKAFFHYTEKEIGHMQFWKYMELFEEHKNFHNALVGRFLYKTEKEDKEELRTEKKVIYF